MYLYNTQTRTKEVFEPRNSGAVTVYVCGPTVSDTPHIGNMRSAVVFDVLHRVLRAEYGDEAVRFVTNITDIDDKIMAKAHERGIEIGVHTEETTEYYLRVRERLGLLPPTAMPRATEFIPEMIAFVKKLIASEHAYELFGHVLFSVASNPAHGSLSGMPLEDLRSGGKGDPAPYKRDQADFVLWKPSNREMPGWNSPWGRGRPGWHLECSAMIGQLLGSTIDIHGGGNDLIFPHHENENAQSSCAHGAPLSQVWMHNGMLTVNGGKMSKSDGTFITCDQVFDRASPMALRYLFLTGHYRQPLDFTWERLEQASAAIARLRRAARLVKPQQGGGTDAFMSHLRDDLNTPEALAYLSKAANTLFSDDPKLDEAKPEISYILNFGLELLGLDGKVVEAKANAFVEEVEGLVEDRRRARLEKRWADADQIRTRLSELAVEISDNGTETTWSFTR